MPAKIIDGTEISRAIQHKVAADITDRSKKGFKLPTLAVVLVGSDSASQIYVNSKKQACESTGIRSIAYHLPENTTSQQLLTLINKLNNDPDIHGILVQLPLPMHINSNTVIDNINPEKDVDGFHPVNIGYLAQGLPKLRPCTPKGIITLLQHTRESIRGKNAVMIGASNIVGRPMSLELLREEATVTTCHIYTQNLDQHVNQADILIVAIGKPGVINSQWIKKGAIVIDVAMNRNKNGGLTGDLEFESAREKAAWITPVPGGVGPMTVASLMENTLEAANSIQNFS